MAWHGRRLVTCAHCARTDASCCQCAGTRIVSYAVAEKSGVWIWEFGSCPCAACQRLKGVRHAISISR